MKTSVQIRSFDGFSHIRSFVENAVVESIGKFEAKSSFDTHVVLGMARKRSDNHRPIFDCVLWIRNKDFGSPIVIKRTHSDIYQALDACLQASEKALRRLSRIKTSKRRLTKSVYNLAA